MKGVNQVNMTYDNDFCVWVIVFFSLSKPIAIHRYIPNKVYSIKVRNTYDANHHNIAGYRCWMLDDVVHSTDSYQS